MDIRQLTHFVGVATHGSFSNAARKMHISQPALTRSVQLLEGILEVNLFDRTYQGIELTNDGHTLFRHASLIINSLQNAKSEIAASKDGGFGEVRLGIASLFTNFLVDEAVSRVAKANDNFAASIRVGLYEDMASMLDEGLLDLVISSNTEVEQNSDVDFEVLCDISAVLVGGTKNPLTQKQSLDLGELQGEPWVTLYQPHMEAFLTSFFAQGGLTAPRCKVRTSSLEMLRSLIRKQHFIGFLPSHWVAADIKAGILSVIQAPGTPITRKAGIVTRKTSILNRSAQTLVEEMRLIAKDLS